MNNNTIRTETKIGTFVVDVTTPHVVHVVKNDDGDCRMITNQIVYGATIENFMGDKGLIKRGYTFTTTIDPNLFVVTDQFSLLINPKTIQLFSVKNGNWLN